MSRRKVTFSMPVTHIEYREYESEDTDDQPYSSLYWAHVAADRDRFKKRIEQLSSILSRVFDKELRQEVYRERFENYQPQIPETLYLNKTENTSIETVTNSSITSTSSTSQLSATTTTIDSPLSSSQSSPTKQSVTPIIDSNKEDKKASNQVTAINNTTSAVGAVVDNQENDNQSITTR